MRIAPFHNASPALQFVITLLFCLTGLLVFILIGSIIVFAGYGIDGIQSIQTPNLNDSGSLEIIKILQVCQTIGLFIAPAILLSFLFSDKPSQFLMMRGITLTQTLYSVFAILLAFPAINLLSSLNMLIDLPAWMDEMEKNAMEITNAFMNTRSFSGFTFNVFMIALLPALGEELIFRGILQRIFTDWTRSAVIGILISAVLFSFMHLQFQGFIPRLALGVLFGFLFLWTRSIWIPITVHFCNNFLAIVGYTLMNRGLLPQETETIGGIGEMWPLGLVSLIAVLGIMWMIRIESLRSCHIKESPLE